jgi:hypothetical protein
MPSRITAFGNLAVSRSHTAHCSGKRRQQRYDGPVTISSPPVCRLVTSAVLKLKKSKRDENDILGFDFKIE